MKDKPASPSAAILHAALLDYYGAPGKYQLTRRQPAVLFASIRDILQIAAGRDNAPREAAMFFIRAALLYPGADHYAVLGLPAGREPTELKERYRLLMRLTHPDFATGGPADWPADAAMQVNRAYEVLSSPVLRREYDEQLASLHAQRTPVSGNATIRPSAAAPMRPEIGPLPAKRKAAWVFGATVATLAVLILLPRQEPDHLVQRSPVAAAAPEQTALVPPEALQAMPTPEEAAPSLPQARPQAQPQSAAAAAASVVPATGKAAAVPRSAPASAASSPSHPALARSMAATPLAAAPAARGVSALPRAELPPVPVPPPLPPPPAPALSPMPPVASPASSAAQVRITSTVASMAMASPSLSDAQPLLTQMLQLLESGSGEQLLRLLDGNARQAPGAQALSRQYEQLVKGARPIRLVQVEFKGEPRDGVLLVTGRIRLHAGEPAVGSHGQRFLLRAEFVSRGGNVMLTGLSGQPD